MGFDRLAEEAQDSLPTNLLVYSLRGMPRGLPREGRGRSWRRSRAGDLSVRRSKCELRRSERERQ